MTYLFTILALLAVLSSGLCDEDDFLQRPFTAFNARQYQSLLTVGNGGPWGRWTWSEMCPENFYAVGFSIRVETSQGKGDDTALNGIRIICAKNGDRSLLFTVESHPGYWGKWTQPQYCPSGFITALRVEPAQGSDGDDTAANNIRFRCSSYNTILEGSGHELGAYGSWSETCSEGGICGPFETKIEKKQGDGDDTALNESASTACVRTQQSEPGRLSSGVVVREM
ncbi:LOW QUALITY PROTEIN: vitelline membrane outer layer protein 1 homolog [Pholidichthys leucotaenia]